MPGELRSDRRINRLHVTARQAELAGPAEQALAVERDGRRCMVGAGEEVGPEALRRVVPDLGAVQRQDDRFRRRLAQQHRELGEEPVAVHVDDVRASDGRRQSLVHRRAPRARRRRESCRASNPSVRRGIQSPGREERPAVRSRRMRDVLDVVAGFGGPEPQLPRQQGVGGLIRRQVRRDVQDAQRSARVSCSSAGGTRRTSPAGRRAP